MEDRQLRYLIAALAVSIAPLLRQLPVWLVAWCILLWGYLLIREKRGWPKFSSRMRLAVLCIGFGAVFVSAGLRFDGADFIKLLAMLAGIKPFEVHSHRDRMITLFLAYFLVITSLFVFENLAMTLYLFLSVFFTTGVLVLVNSREGALKPALQVSGGLLLKALPLTVVLFLFFPRVSGVFWGTPWHRSGQTGFTNVLGLGDVSRLVQVDKVAFTVDFEGNLPALGELYWRGVVFQQFDGQTWRPPGVQPVRTRPVFGLPEVAYKVLMEPHGHKTLFALDLPKAAPAGAQVMSDHTLAARQTVRQKFRYRAISILRPTVTSGLEARQKTLQLPGQLNPKAREMGRSWMKAGLSDRQVLSRALSFFQSGGFTYTLSPGRLGRDAIDDFLFTTRSGFCEHYASALVFLLRAAGVPARIVGGYLGGRWNSMGGYLTVRQSDAHAWAEVWLEGSGWTRVDPTSQVAPQRISAGIESALSPDALPSFLRSAKGSPITSWLRSVQDTWDGISTRWDIWFMGFSAEEQFAILSKIGLHAGNWIRWAALLLTTAATIIAGISLSVLYKRRRPGGNDDEVLQSYNRFLQKMARVGLPKQPHQGPESHAADIYRQAPEIREAVAEITNDYIVLRYSNPSGDVSGEAFKRKVKRFHPRRTLQKISK